MAERKISRRAFITGLAGAALAGYAAGRLPEAPVAHAMAPDDDRIHRKEEGPVTEVVGKNQIVVEQGDSYPNNDRNYPDKNANTALISIYNWNNDQVGLNVRVENGDDWAIFTWDDCPSSWDRSFEGAKARAWEYAQQVAQMKITRAGEEKKVFDRVDIKKYGIDGPQG